jgi:hypothetical protein
MRLRHTADTRVALLTVLAFALTLPASAAQSPALRIVDSLPATLRGTGFHRDERVVVTLRMGSGRWKREARASSAGRFTARFKGLRLRYCAVPLTISARGDRGSVAHAHIPRRECAPD